jgi:hypothetical protein
MTPGYLTALRHSIRTRVKSGRSEKSLQSTPLISLNSLFSHPRSERNGTEGITIAESHEPVTVAERSSTQKLSGCEKSELSEKSPSQYSGPFRALERRCPEFVEAVRWQQAVEDGRLFLAPWGEQAHALGWTSRELFGLHTAPERPAGNNSRLSRYDETGLIWLLRGRAVIALTKTTAAIQGATGVLTYRKLNKPALGPPGDSLDDFNNHRIGRSVS